MKFQTIECVLDCKQDSFGRKSLIDEWLSDPISNGRRLRDIADDLRNSELPHDLIGRSQDNEEPVISALFPLIERRYDMLAASAAGTRVRPVQLGRWRPRLKMILK